MGTTISTVPTVTSVDLTGLFVGTVERVDITPWASETSLVRLRSIDVSIQSDDDAYAQPVWLILAEPGNSDVFLGMDFTHDALRARPFVSDEATPITYTPTEYPTFPPSRFRARIEWHRCLVLSPSTRIQLAQIMYSSAIAAGVATFCWERVQQ